MNKKFIIKVGILAACAGALSYLCLTPVIGEMCASFPDKSASLVQLVITLPALMFIITSPVAGMLGRTCSPRKMLLVSLALYLVGGLFPFFFHSSVWFLLAGSVVIGLGSGLMMPTINVAICTNFEGEERGKLMGLNATFAAIGATALILISGQLSKLGWHYSYLSFLVIIPLGILVYLMPENDRRGQAEEAPSGSGFQMDKYIFFLFLLGFVYFTTQNAFNSNSALYMEERGLGGADFASLVTTCNTMGGIIGGILFGRIASVTKGQVGTTAVLLAGLGFLTAYYFASFMPLIAGAVLVGASFALYNAAGTLLLSQSIRPENNSFTLSVYLAFVNIGGSLSPVIINALSGLFNKNVSTRFAFSGWVIIIAAGVSFAVNAIHGKKRITNK